jgi:alpha-galactosidase
MSACIQTHVEAGVPMVYSLCSWGSDEPWTYGPKIANSWRVSADQQPLWESVMRSVDNTKAALLHAAPGGWNDLDELFMVKGPMSYIERQTMFNLWTILAAPLSIGDNVVALADDPKALALYTNKEVIAINQDVLGKPGVKILGEDLCVGGGLGELQWVEVWARPLADGDVAVLLFNRGSWGGCTACAASLLGCACVGIDFSDIARLVGQPQWATANVSARFVWNHTDASDIYTGSMPPAILEPHESLLVRLRLVK